MPLSPAVDVDIGGCRNCLNALLCILSIPSISLLSILPHVASPCSIGGVKHVSCSFSFTLIPSPHTPPLPPGSILLLYLSLITFCLIFSKSLVYGLLSFLLYL